MERLIATCLTSLMLAACSNAQNEARPASATPQSVSGASDREPTVGPANSPGPQILTQAVEYRAGGTVLKGYLASPKAPGQYPGVLVVPEWWGQNAYAQMRARKLAELGYLALAVDMYGEGRTTDDPKQAGALAQSIHQDPTLEKDRFVAAREYLASHPNLEGSKIAAIGYCFGGGVVLNMLRAGVPLDAAASFHGTLSTDHPLAADAYHGQVLIETGGDDSFVPLADVEAVKAEMENAGAALRVDVYPGAKHAFTNPAASAVGRRYNLPIAYDAEADQASWQQLLELLRRTWGA